VATRTASGSVGGPAGRAKTALASRIYVEGRHDAELVEKIWGDDLRHVGVVVEYLGGIDHLPASWPTSRRQKGGGSGSWSITWCLGARSRESRTGPERDWPRSRVGAGSSVRGHLAGGEANQAGTGRLAGGTADRRMEAWDLRRPGAAAQGSGRLALEDDLGQVVLELTPLLTVVEQLIDFVTEDHQ
jgi:hypothetical protein